MTEATSRRNRKAHSYELVMSALSTEGKRGSLGHIFSIPTIEVWFVFTEVTNLVTNLVHFAIQPRTSLDSRCVQTELFDINQAS